MRISQIINEELEMLLKIGKGLEWAERVKIAEKILQEQFGARLVQPIGSVVGDSPIHEGSDLDLLVEGLDERDYFKAMSVLENALGMKVDIICVESAPPQLLERVRDGKPMGETPLESLKARVDGEIEQLEQLVNEMQMHLHRMPQEPAQQQLFIYGMAKCLEAFYEGMERIFRQIAHIVDGQVPSGEEWHRELLRQMMEKVPNIRPPVIDEQLGERLDEYLRFRHRSRHLYPFDLNWQRMEHLVKGSPQILESFKQALSKLICDLRDRVD